MSTYKDAFPATRRQNVHLRWAPVLLSFPAGLLVVLLILFLPGSSATAAMIAFPYAWLLLRFGLLASVVAGVVQFPLYGLVIGFAKARGSEAMAVRSLLLIHLVAAVGAVIWVHAALAAESSP